MADTKVNPIQIQKFLKGLDYPASKDVLVAHAKQQGADDNALRALQELSDGKFETPADVSQAIGKNQ